MKKSKIGYIAAAALLTLSLAACSNNQSGSGSGSHQASSSQVQKKGTKQANKNSSSVAKNNKQTSRGQSKKPSSQAPESRFDDLTHDLRSVFPGMLLPTHDGLGQGSDHVNVRYLKNGNKSVVYYSVGNNASAFNATSVRSEKPYAVLTETKNGNASLINYSSPQTGLPTKKLDQETTATLQGAAGQKYLQWNKGKYSFVIQASNVLKQDPTQKGQETLALSKEYALPQTTSHGSVYVIVGDSVGSLNTTIAWQNGSSIYQLKAHSTETAFKMLASLK